MSENANQNEPTWEDVGPANKKAALTAPVRITVDSRENVRIILRRDVMAQMGWTGDTTVRLRVSGENETARLLLTLDDGALRFHTTGRSKGTRWLRPSSWWWLNTAEKNRFVCTYEILDNNGLLITPPPEAVLGAEDVEEGEPHQEDDDAEAAPA